MTILAAELGITAPKQESTIPRQEPTILRQEPQFLLDHKNRFKSLAPFCKRRRKWWHFLVQASNVLEKFGTRGMCKLTEN